MGHWWTGVDCILFSLWVGEYTYAMGQWHTQIICLQDVKLFANCQEITPQWAHQFKEHINTILLTIDNQKNGLCGDTISHHALEDKANPCCLVRALVSRVIDLVRDKAKPETLLCAFQEVPSGSWQFVHSKDIVGAVKKALPLAGVDTLGYLEDNVGLHSLRTGGVTTMYINSHDTKKIQCASCWTSNTFMMYIHNHLDIVWKGLSQAMSTATPYLNMAK